MGQRRDLDEAMLETRHFWFEDPTEFDDAWQPILEVYSRADKWPNIPPPSREVCLNTLLHTKDSSPGPDGIPYSAWRLLPEMTLQAMSSYFYDIQEETALPPTQVGVWIPKAKTGPTADFFRPLGMPNMLDRLVDGSNAAHLMHHTAHLLHPSQTVMSYFKEPQRAVAEIQRILDGNFPACALLADLSKAFERVNPYWILHLLRIRGAPRWVIVYAKFVLFHRKVMHKVQGRLLPSRTVGQGVDMGRSFSVYLFCFAMDPLFHYLNRIPGVILFLSLWQVPPCSQHSQSSSIPSLYPTIGQPHTTPHLRPGLSLWQVPPYNQHPLFTSIPSLYPTRPVTPTVKARLVIVAGPALQPTPPLHFYPIFIPTH